MKYLKTILYYLAFVVVIFFVGFFVGGRTAKTIIQTKTVTKVDTIHTHHETTVIRYVASKPEQVHDTVYLDTNGRNNYLREFKDTVGDIKVSSVVNGTLYSQEVDAKYRIPSTHSVDTFFVNKTTTTTQVRNAGGLFVGANTSGLIGASYVKGKWQVDAGYSVVNDAFGNRFVAGVKYKIW